MEKHEILDAIRTCALENGGVPLGRERFYAATGIRESDWIGRHWLRWNDAVAEAGFAPNTLNEALPDERMIEQVAELVRELGHFPTNPELRMRRRSSPEFPSHGAIARLGKKAQLAHLVVEYCESRAGFDDVADLCRPIAAPPGSTGDEGASDAREGVVYLMRSGTHYKIGRSNSVGRREYELAIQLPERLELVHSIETDDPVGIERYWHTRFADRRANGEWFALTRADVAAFRRRKRFM